MEGETEEAVERSWVGLLVRLVTPSLSFLLYSSLYIVPASLPAWLTGCSFPIAHTDQSALALPYTLQLRSTSAS